MTWRQYLLEHAQACALEWWDSMEKNDDPIHLSDINALLADIVESLAAPDTRNGFEIVPSSELTRLRALEQKASDTK